MLKSPAIFAFILFAIIACKKDGLVNQNLANRGIVITKVKSGESLKIACEGTSLTYGEDIEGTDTISAALPGGPTRAKLQYPTVMLQALNNPKITLSLRGFPGDRTTDALTRWQDSTSADICIIEYGTNDAYNFASLPGGVVPVDLYQSQLKQLVERRINQGAWVILCLPPLLESNTNSIGAYRTAAIKIAEQLNLPVLDVEESIKDILKPYSDRVHLNATGYQKWGLDMANLLKVVGQ